MRQRIITAFVLLVAILSYGQNGLIEISEIKNLNDTIQINPSGIIDINSDLELKIMHKNIAMKVGNSTKANPQLISELEKYNQLLIFQKGIQEDLNTDLTNATLSERITVLGRFSDKVSDFYEELFKDKELEDKFETYWEAFEKLSVVEQKKYGNYYVPYGFEQLLTEITENLKQLQENIDQKKIKIQVTAYLNTMEEVNKKVHVENFDEYELGEFYKVDRWVTSFSKEDIVAFNNNQELANELNDLVNNNFNDIQSVLKDNIGSVECINNLLKKINQMIADRETIFNANLSVASLAMYKIKESSTELYKIAANIKNYDGTSGNALELFNETQEEFITKAEILSGEIAQIFQNLPAEIRDNNPEIISLKGSFESCKNTIDTDIAKLKKIALVASNLLMPSRIAAQNGMDIGKKVYAYGISELPEKGYIDLKRTGKRANGDQLLIRVTINTPDAKNERLTTTTIDKMVLTLQQIKVYSRSNVSVILASPFNASDNVMLENKFQFTPSGSLLFKFGSRRSRTWNYLEPGIGFNISTPDFDLDGTPEIGLGGVITVLKDVLSIGVSYNTKTDNPYWFFGLSLPFSIPGVPINNVQTNANN